MVTVPHQFKIAMLFCYYGKFPWYFDYFCKSCSYNPSIDFFIFTDNEAGRPLPPNIRIVRKTLADIKKIADAKFGFPTAIDNPYKLCDLKPAYGYIFSEYITGYDFWGHGDIDVMYGDIRTIITDEVLEKHDVISGRPEYLSGFFTLFRNDPYITTLFQESKDYKKVYQDAENYCFDECNWNFSRLWKGQSILEIETEIECMTYVVKKLVAAGRIRAFFEMIVVEGVRQKLQWNNGVLLSSTRNKAMALYHFIEFKKLPFHFVPRWKKIPDKLFIHSFYISRYDPVSVRGRIVVFFLQVARFSLFKILYLLQFVKWLVKYYNALRCAHVFKEFQKRELTGIYRLEDMRIQINIRGEKMFAEWTGYPPVLLLWQKDRTFLAGKFFIDDNFNIDVEFVFNRKKDAYSLHIRPFRKEKLVLLKDQSQRQ
jgi:hypothetical protein